MESITQEGLVFDVGSLFGRLQGLSDKTQTERPEIFAGIDPDDHPAGKDLW
jgi:hypothetical protein